MKTTKHTQARSVVPLLLVVLACAVALNGCVPGSSQPPRGQVPVPLAPPEPVPVAPPAVVLPVVEIERATTSEVVGHAYDPAYYASRDVQVELLPGDPTLAPDRPLPLLKTIANVNAPDTIFPGHGFRFDLSRVSPARRSQLFAGKQVVVRASRGNRVSSSAPRMLEPPAPPVTLAVEIVRADDDEVSGFAIESGNMSPHDVKVELWVNYPQLNTLWAREAVTIASVPDPTTPYRGRAYRFDMSRSPNLNGGAERQVRVRAITPFLEADSPGRTLSAAGATPRS